jgi:hypothetical protein
MALGDEPYNIENPRYGYDRPRHTNPPEGTSEYYSADQGQFLKDATSFSLYQLHNDTSNAFHKLGEGLASDASGATAHGISPDTSRKLHAAGQAFGKVAMGHFDDAMNRPDRVLNKMQFQRTERLNGGAANYRPREN